MFPLRAWLCALIAFVSAFPCPARIEGDAIVHEQWFEARTTHFNIYSCGTRQEVSTLATRLEQFRDAYGLLAGAQAVSSPPIIVMAFPDQAALHSFLPLYQGQAANLSGFFIRNGNENLIVLALSGTNSGSMATIFHEFTHLLFRHNDNVWPLWLQEGMAEMYSTFEASGRGVRIGLPIRHHLRLLAQGQFMPLSELLTVSHDSPQYNESEHQGVFYAESWLLTHYLMNGDNPAYKARFGQFTKLLRQGQSPEAAFTNALGAPLSSIEAGLKRYLERGEFEPVGYVVPVDLSAPHQIVTRPVGQIETCFRLGDELMRIERFDTAEQFFKQAQKLAPASPLSYEGLGMLADARDKRDEALRELKEALQRGSTSYLAHYFYAKERLRLTGDGQERYTHVDPEIAEDIRKRLQQAIALMPSFAPAQNLLGFFETVQGEHPADAVAHLQKAVQLEPQNQWYLLDLAQAEMLSGDTASARRTLDVLRKTAAEPKLRAHVEAALKQMEREEKQK